MLQDSQASDNSEVDMQRLQNLEDENKALKSMIEKLEARVAALELHSSDSSQPAPPKVSTSLFTCSLCHASCL